LQVGADGKFDGFDWINIIKGRNQTVFISTFMNLGGDSDRKE